jgi:hypothetical protein
MESVPLFRRGGREDKNVFRSSSPNVLPAVPKINLQLMS